MSDLVELLRKGLAGREEAADEIERLRAAILGAHPAGQDEVADPLEVLATLAREWLEMTMAGPPQAVEFIDDDGNPGKLQWEDGDESVGLQGGYVIAEYEEVYKLQNQVETVRVWFTEAQSQRDAAQAQLAEKDAEISRLAEKLGRREVSPLDCPWCGGSGHKDDMTPYARRMVDIKVAAEAIARVFEPEGAVVHDNTLYPLLDKLLAAVNRQESET